MIGYFIFHCDLESLSSSGPQRKSENTRNHTKDGTAPAVVSNCVLSRLILKEHLTYIAMLGVVLALVGAVGVALNAPSEEVSGRLCAFFRGAFPTPALLHPAIEDNDARFGSG